jgi:hypothetical protein
MDTKIPKDQLLTLIEVGRLLEKRLNIKTEVHLGKLLIELYELVLKRREERQFDTEASADILTKIEEEEKRQGETLSSENKADFINTMLAKL